MNWTMLGALGEVLGALVVGATLIYLARQLRLSNVHAQAEAYRTLSGRAADLVITASTVPEFRRGWWKVAGEGATPEDLDIDQHMAVIFFYEANLSWWEQAFRDVANGVLPEDSLQEFQSSVFTYPYFRSVWPRLRGEHSPDFLAYFEQRFQLEAGESDAGSRRAP